MKQKRCLSCRELFEPVRRKMVLTKFCTAACELDHAEKNPKVAKPKPKKPKMRKLKCIKDELWGLFTLHQKLVHSKDGEWCQCYTCDKPIQIGTIDCQGGHCSSKAANGALWFDERAVRPQCSYCNCAEEGNSHIFHERLKQEIGMQAWQDMWDNRKQLNKYPRQWCIEHIEYYKAQNEIIYKIKQTTTT